MRRGGVGLVALIMCGLVAACGSNSPPPPASTTSPDPSISAARIVETVPIDAQSQDLVIFSPAVGREVKVRLLLPADFSTAVGPWPTLYLLQGCCDTYASWTLSTDVEELARTQELIVAMPEGGSVGFYSDWKSGPRWETFHTVELPALLAATYHASDRRAVAGLSMGGLGALSYAARDHGMYAAAASFSGIVDTRLSADESQTWLGLVESYGENPLALWGDPDSDADTWKAHNPYDLAPGLKGIPIFVSCGNGRPGPLDPRGTLADETEQLLGVENAALAARATALGLDARFDLYGPGTHTWSYWQRELHKAWPMLVTSLGLPAPRRASH
jgi:diacylglycerol O-acyltransferase / trehalose O-mycolyltransferase